MAIREDASLPRSLEVPTWSNLAPGDELTVVKLAPDGSQVARYPGAVASHLRAGGWVEIQAAWTYRRIDIEGLIFEPGDVLHEWFSPLADFNAFALHAPNGAFKGWYSNVTFPARLQGETAPPTLIWHDLYVDVIVLADGTTTVCDEDELAASRLAQSDPHLQRRIVRARDEVLRRIGHRLIPFDAYAKLVS
jgi:hypothetical protein